MIIFNEIWSFKAIYDQEKSVCSDLITSYILISPLTSLNVLNSKNNQINYYSNLFKKYWQAHRMVDPSKENGSSLSSIDYEIFIY